MDTIHSAILFTLTKFDTNQVHWLIGTPYLAIIANKECRVAPDALKLGQEKKMAPNDQGRISNICEQLIHLTPQEAQSLPLIPRSGTGQDSGRSRISQRW